MIIVSSEYFLPKNTQEYRKRYANISEEKRLTKVEKVLYAFLIAEGDETGDCRETIQTILVARLTSTVNDLTRLTRRVRQLIKENEELRQTELPF